MTGSVHPRSGPSMMPSTRRPMPMADTIEPRMSNATRSSARVLGTTRIMPTHATAASAAVRTKTEPQANCSSSAPDARMPRVPPAPAKPAQMPTALARSSGGNTLVMVDSVPGMSSAAPIAHERAQRDELVGRPGECRQSGGDAEDGRPGDERAPAPEAVADRAGGQQERGQGRARRRRRSTAATTGWRRGRRRCWAGRWRASRPRRRPSPGRGTSPPGSSPGWRTRSWCRRRGRGRVGPVRATRCSWGAPGVGPRGMRSGGMLTDTDGASG